MATTQELIAQQQELLARGRLSRREIQDLNRIQTQLRNKPGVSYSQAPNYKMSGGSLVAKKGIGAVTGAYGYNATPGSYQTEQEQETGYRIEQDAVPFSDRVQSDQAINQGRATAGDVLGRGSVSLTRENLQVLRERAIVAQQNAQRREAQGDARSPYVYGYRPIASTIEGGYVFQAERTGEQYTATPKQVGSNITSFELSPTQLAGQIKRVQVKPSVKEDYLENVIKRASAIANNRGVVKTAEFVETKVNPVVFPIVKQGVTVGLRGLDKANRTFAKPDYSTTPLANTSFAKNGGVLGITRRIGEKISTFDPKLETLPSLRGATALGVTQKLVTPGVLGLRNVAGEFVTYASTKPVTTALGTFGLRRVLGEFAYGVLDKGDVLTSIVTESGKTYLSGKGVLASISSGAGAFAGEKFSDKTIGVFDFARPTTITTDNVFSTKFRLKSRDTFVVTPRTSASGKVIPNKFTVKYGVTPSFKTYTKLPSARSLNIGRFGTPEPLVFYESTVLQADVKPFGKSTLPKYVQMDLNTGVLRPTRATLRSRPVVRVQRFFPGRNSLFASKRGQMSLIGGDSSYTGTTQDFAGRFEDFTGRYSTTEPEAPNINNKPVAKLLSRTRVKVQRSFAQSQPKALSLTQTQITTKFKPRLKVLTFDSIGSKTRTNALTRSLTQDLTQSLTETPTLSLTQSLTQTQTRSLTVTPTLTRTLTQTRTLTRTPTRTPTITITPTRPKLSKLFKKPKAFKTPKTIMRTLKEDYYTPSLFAVAFNKRGRETKLLTVSGLGIRPIRLR